MNWLESRWQKEKTGQEEIFLNPAELLWDNMKLDLDANIKELHNKEEHNKKNRKNSKTKDQQTPMNNYQMCTHL